MAKRIPAYDPDPSAQLQLHKFLYAWGKKNTTYLKVIEKGTEVLPLTELKELHNDCMQQWIVDYGGWSAITTIQPRAVHHRREDVLGTIETRLSQEAQAAAVIVRHCASADIFVELSRTNFIIAYLDIMDESKRIEEDIRVNGLPKGEYRILWSLENATHFHVPKSSTAIMAYKQPEVIQTLLMLTERINYLPFEAFEETKKLLDLLYTRNGVFFCQESDFGDMSFRDYMTFCSIYFHAVRRRIFYYELLGGGSAVAAVKGSAVKQWVETVVCGSLGTEGFEDCFAKSCEEAYNFPGDMEWFKYRYPNLPVQTGSILGCFRADLAKRYYSGYRLSVETVLASVDQDTHSGHCARLFVINAIDQYMRIHYSIPWKDGLVIDNDGLEGAHVKLFRSDAPYLVQVFSRYSVYHKAKIYSHNSIYDAIAQWMVLLKTHYDGVIFENVSILALINKLL